MVVINLQNVEDLVLKKGELRKLMPDLTHLFDQWHLSCRLPTLRSMGTKAKLDLINMMNADHVRILEEHFQDSVVLDKLDYDIVKNLSFPVDLERLGGLLSGVEGFANFTVSRDASNCYLCFWR